MKGVTFKGIDLLCAQLIKSRNSATAVDRVVGDGIKHRIIDGDTLPLVIQRINTTTNGGWCLALQILQSEQLKKNGIKRDNSIWRIVEQGSPKEAKTQQVVHEALRGVFSPPNSGRPASRPR